MSSNLTKDRDDALYRAAMAIEMRGARDHDGRPLAADELAAFEGYQTVARSHGFTDADIRRYQRTQLG
ncbi:hypothetical protein OG747_36565 [Streptomyces sp. NBC_01384]|uniref:hypothetical protein n=1 Tax=Streptomyces sp. NBC_01384 TaxID=2903847 RepID=UPI003249BB23